MASGADAEAAAAKLQARMRGNVARTRVAGLREAQEGNSVVEASVNDTTEAGGAGETEEMASGADENEPGSIKAEKPSHKALSIFNQPRRQSLRDPDHPSPGSSKAASIEIGVRRVPNTAQSGNTSPSAHVHTTTPIELEHAMEPLDHPELHVATTTIQAALKFKNSKKMHRTDFLKVVTSPRTTTSSRLDVPESNVAVETKGKRKLGASEIRALLRNAQGENIRGVGAAAEPSATSVRSPSLAAPTRKKHMIINAKTLRSRLIADGHKTTQPRRQFV